jgi:hypothetical protein
MKMSGIGNRMMNSASRMAQDFFGPNRGNRDNVDAWGHPVRQQQSQDGNNNNGDPNDPKNKKGLANNGSVDDSDIDSIWKKVQSGDDGTNNNGDNNQTGNNNNNNNNNPTQLTPEEQLQKYLKDQGLDPIVLTDDDKEKIAAGDLTGLISQLNDKIVRAHTKAITSSGQLMDEKITAAVDKALKETRNYVDTKDNLDALHEAIPYSRDGAIGPVMQTVMQRLLDRGANRAEAIKGTKMWADHFFKKANPDFDPANVGNNNSGTGNTRNGQKVETNWLDVLGASRG